MRFHARAHADGKVYRIPFTSEEEVVRDAEEALWTRKLMEIDAQPPAQPPLTSKEIADLRTLLQQADRFN